jgi:hypothetical protein
VTGAGSACVVTGPPAGRRRARARASSSRARQRAATGLRDGGTLARRSQFNFSSAATGQHAARAAGALQDAIVVDDAAGLAARAAAAVHTDERTSVGHHAPTTVPPAAGVTRKHGHAAGYRAATRPSSNVHLAASEPPPAATLTHPQLSQKARAEPVDDSDAEGGAAAGPAYVAPIANPLAGKKLLKKALKVVKKGACGGREGWWEGRGGREKEGRLVVGTEHAAGG